MTTDTLGQGIIDFSAFMKSKQSRRSKLRAGEYVPWERVKVLADVRLAWGIKYREIEAVSDLNASFICKVLTGNQHISLDEFDRLKSALADVVFQRTLDAAGGKS